MLRVDTGFRYVDDALSQWLLTLSPTKTYISIYRIHRLWIGSKRHQDNIPPSTVYTEPVVKELAGLRRKRMTCATSSAVPILFSGV